MVLKKNRPHRCDFLVGTTLFGGNSPPAILSPSPLPLLILLSPTQSSSSPSPHSSSSSPSPSHLPYLYFSVSFFSIELFADSCGIAHLRQCFAEVKEIVRASLHPDLQQMADNVNLRKSLFPRLDPLRLAALLEKVNYIAYFRNSTLVMGDLVMTYVF